MIIDIIDLMRLAALELKSNAPVSGNFNRIEFLLFRFQRMQVISGRIHILNIVCRIQPVENPCDSGGMFCLNALFVPGMEEQFKTFMPE